MPTIKQLEAERALLQSFFRFAGIGNIGINAQREVTKSPNFNIEWNAWVAHRAAHRQETPVSAFFELEKRRHKPLDNNLYLVPSRPLLNGEWRRVAPLLKGLESVESFQTAIRVTTEDYVTHTIKKPGL